ncbi:MAG: endonuclease III [Spirochaetales bacterium]|nr:endonuclease III [Spirochaetales bacterium]
MNTRPIPWDYMIQTMREALAGQELPSVSLISRVNNDPFAILVSTMISLRTKDQVTLEAFNRLYEKAHSPMELARLNADTIEKLIFPAGFYKTKARNLKKSAHIIISRFSGNVPNKIDDLLSLPGVGRKTANLVLSLGFNIPAICVDTHVHRISNRLGWVKTKSPEETELALLKILPKKYWIEINEILVKYGQALCRPNSPWCSRCPVAGSCPKTGVIKQR